MGEFKVGDTVEWTSQSSGTVSTKRGKVVVVIPPKEFTGNPAGHYAGLAGLRYTHIFLFGGFQRDHESYLISVPSERRDKRSYLYHPNVSHLRLVEERTDIRYAEGEGHD